MSFILSIFLFFIYLLFTLSLLTFFYSSVSNNQEVSFQVAQSNQKSQSLVLYLSQSVLAATNSYFTNNKWRY